MRQAAPLALAFALVLAATDPTRASDAVPSPKDGASLTAIELGPGDHSYTLVCGGPCEPRLVLAGDGALVTVELPRVTNAIEAGTLPPPRGLVRDIAMRGEGDGSLRVLFSLRQPAAAVLKNSERGFEVQIGSDLPTPAAAPSAAPLGAEDLLEIDVFEIPDLDRTVRISERGTISLPLVGELPAEGLTPLELESRLREELAKRYVQDPQVSVFVKEHGSKRVSVLGAVGKPGVYEMLGPRNLLQVLSQAGGLTKEVGATLYVIRATPGGEAARMAVDVSDLLVNKDTALNLAIQAGDVISVPMDEPVYIYVDGAVKTPGRIEQMASRPITLLQAIAKAGGVTERADLKGVQILRRGDRGTQTVVQVNLKRVRHGKEPDPALQDGDIVVVPETFF